MGILHLLLTVSYYIEMIKQNCLCSVLKSALIWEPRFWKFYIDFPNINSKSDIICMHNVDKILYIVLT